MGERAKELQGLPMRSTPAAAARSWKEAAAARRIGGSSQVMCSTIGSDSRRAASSPFSLLQSPKSEMTVNTWECEQLQSDFKYGRRGRTTIQDLGRREQRADRRLDGDETWLFHRRMMGG